MYNVDMSLPLVSIIVPVFNTGKSAKKLVSNILGGKYSNVEIILVDDGSTDDSLEILKSIKSNKVNVYSKKNGGPSAGRNFGLERARGEYLLFIDSDDEIKDDFISKLVKNMCNDGVVLVSTGIVYEKVKEGTGENLYLQSFVRGDGERLEKFVLRSLLKDGRMYPVFNKIFDAEVVRKNNLRFDEKMNYGEDTKFVLDYLKKKDGEVRFILEPLYVYNVGTATSTAAKTVGVWSNWQKCYANLRKWVGRKASFDEKILLRLIYLKWRASWLKAKLS